jgi:hypothetical protein
MESLDFPERGRGPFQSSLLCRNLYGENDDNHETYHKVQSTFIKQEYKTSRICLSVCLSVCVVPINDTALELSFSSFLYLVSSHIVGTLTCDWPAQEHGETYRGADKSLARAGRKQATATEDFDFHVSYL